MRDVPCVRNAIGNAVGSWEHGPGTHGYQLGSRWAYASCSGGGGCRVAEGVVGGPAVWALSPAASASESGAASVCMVHLGKAVPVSYFLGHKQRKLTFIPKLTC